MSNTRSNTERTSITLPRSLSQRLRLEAQGTGRTFSGIIQEALRNYFEQQGSPHLPSFTGIGDSGTADTSQQAEEILAARFRRK